MKNLPFSQLVAVFPKDGRRVRCAAVRQEEKVTKEFIFQLFAREIFLFIL